MHQKNPSPLHKTGINYLFLFFVLFFFFGFLYLKPQLLTQGKENNDEVTELITRMDHLFDQMNLVLLESEKYVDSSCSPADIHALENIIAFYPTVRAIHIVKADRIWCSSLYWTSGRNVNADAYKANRVDIYKSQREVTVFALRLPYKDGVISVTSDFYFINDVSHSVAVRDKSIYLEVNRDFFDVSGNLVSESDFNKSDFSVISSEKYPYTIYLPFRKDFSFIILIRSNVFFLLFDMLFSGFIIAVLSKLNTHRHSPEKMLKKAISEGDIIPYYQPLICGKTNKITGVEVLARWSHSQLGIVSPDEFIPLAEETGLIIPLTKKLLEIVVNDISCYENLLSDGFCININICQAHLEDVGFSRNYETLTSRLAKINGKVCLEITESHALELNEHVIQGIFSARNMGVLISLDDFGTGNSNLSYIKELHPDSIKIDKTFIENITDDESDLVLVDTMIALAKTIGIKVVAEGVETDYQKDLLISKGVDILQGFYFSRPLPVGDFFIYMKNF